MPDNRITRDYMLREIALLMSRRGTCERLNVGAVLARQGRVVSSGYVGAPAGVEHCNFDNCKPNQACRRTIHAEANAIAWAAREGRDTLGCDLYVTHSPCIECAKLLINAGIKRVVYLFEYRDLSPLELLKEVGIITEHSGAEPES